MYSTLIVRKKNLYLHTHLLYGHVSCQFLYVTAAPYNFTNIHSQNQSTNVKRRLDKYNQLKTLFLAVLRKKYATSQGKNVANTVFASLHCTKCTSSTVT